MTSNGNGTYSKEFTVKTYIALGTHEVLVKPWIRTVHKAPVNLFLYGY